MCAGGSDRRLPEARILRCNRCAPLERDERFVGQEREDNTIASQTAALVALACEQQVENSTQP
jgi:hypothetical protein